jgi:hypothetical protein
MIKNPEMLQQFEDQFISGQGRVSHAQARKLLAALWQEGVMLGVLPPADPMTGIEVDIRVARILNSCSIKS